MKLAFSSRRLRLLTLLLCVGSVFVVIVFVQLSAQQHDKTKARDVETGLLNKTAPPNDLEDNHGKLTAEGRLALVNAVKKYLMPTVYFAYKNDSRTLFENNERDGLHILPEHFYSIIPKITGIPDKLFQYKSSMAGIDLQYEQQHVFVDGCAHYTKEFQDLFPRRSQGESLDPLRYYPLGANYGGGDGSSLYCMIRSRRPKQIIELGSGDTTLLMGQAALQNGKNGSTTLLHSFDPYFKLGQKPSDVPGLAGLEAQSAEKLTPELFQSRLQAGDFLFIDTSHVMHMTSDVRHLILEILPALPVGVLVHFHDIFLPYHYPETWIREQLRFWNEQYFLQAFLVANRMYKVVYACHAYSVEFPDRVRRSLLPGGGCFWIQRVE